MTSDTCFDILRHESNFTPNFLTLTAGTRLLPRMSVGQNNDISMIRASRMRFCAD